MLVSRALGLIRKTAQMRLSQKTPVKTQTRSSHDHAHHNHDPADGWSYRTAPKPQPQWEMFANLVGGFMWWWILYQLYHNGHHLLGNPNYPDPSKWTDAELGIPPDDQPYENFNPETCVYPPGFYDRK